MDHVLGTQLGDVQLSACGPPPILPRIAIKHRVLGIVGRETTLCAAVRLLYSESAAELERLEILDEGSVEPTTTDEVVACAVSMPNRKAPGPDGIQNEIINTAVTTDPQYFTGMFNKCLNAGAFPAR